MKAIKAVDKKPELVNVPEPGGDGVRVKVVSSSICGSDLLMMASGAFGDHVIGHEFAGVTGDGRAVAIEPITGCGHCASCDEGNRVHCDAGIYVMGVLGDGGMAEYATVPAANLVELPTGLDIHIASLVEPLAVAVHGLDRARVREGDRILVIGAGPIGLATGAALRHRGIAYDIAARHDHQRIAADQLGAGLNPNGHYDVVIDAVGSSESLLQSAQMVKPLGRVGLLGVSWEAVDLQPQFTAKEAELIPSLGYNCKSPQRNFEEAGAILHRHPSIADALVTHRFPLDGVTEAFATAADRAAGAIKVVFDVA
ncbi:Alcohol dehydrogenase GroES-like domain family [marine gamma proteobacterium HTCC2148]|nr:Alcohol dehydrogenase GroES-like domain family [marine gamma proteobacterium HTCC2148]MDG1388791.1 Zn-dependent alcohol dehydrogenase [Halioglobus sp.]